MNVYMCSDSVTRADKHGRESAAREDIGMLNCAGSTYMYNTYIMIDLAHSEDFNELNEHCIIMLDLAHGYDFNEINEPCKRQSISYW